MYEKLKNAFILIKCIGYMPKYVIISLYIRLHSQCIPEAWAPTFLYLCHITFILPPEATYPQPLNFLNIKKSLTTQKLT